MRAFASTAIILAMITLGCSGAQNSQRTRDEATGLAQATAQNPSIVTTDVELVADTELVAERLALAEAFTGVILLSRHRQPLLRRAFGV